jgi:hypothetical protein
MEEIGNLRVMRHGQIEASGTPRYLRSLNEIQQPYLEADSARSTNGTASANGSEPV